MRSFAGGGFLREPSAPLFTEVRGRGILGRSDAGCCIESRSHAMGRPLVTLAARGWVLHVVVAHNDSATRIDTSPIAHLEVLRVWVAFVKRCGVWHLKSHAHLAEVRGAAELLSASGR